MVNPAVTQIRNSVFPNPNRGSHPDQYRGGNTTRQSRFDLRSQRRWGDWGLLEFPSALLWFDEECVLGAFEEPVCLAPVPIFLWPE